MSEGESEEAEEEEELSPDGMPPEPSKLYPTGVQGKNLKKKLCSMRKFYVAPQNQVTAAPEWFRLRDLDGDGQLTLAEYAPHATQAELPEFARYDFDHDGVITLKEVARFGDGAGGSHAAASGSTSAIAGAASATTGAADANRAAVSSKASRNYAGSTAAGANGVARSTTVAGANLFHRAPLPHRDPGGLRRHTPARPVVRLLTARRPSATLAGVVMELGVGGRPQPLWATDKQGTPVQFRDGPAAVTEQRRVSHS